MKLSVLALDYRGTIARGDVFDPSVRAAIASVRTHGGQAVALPVTEEAGGDLRMFTIGPRITPHVRHREQYVDVPVTESKAFVFGATGMPFGRARTLCVTAVGAGPPSALEAYLRRGDFTRWIGDVFGDRALADELRAEDRHHHDSRPETTAEVIQAVTARYDLVDESEPEVESAVATPTAV